jgi:histidyl-tRNA synthetase
MAENEKEIGMKDIVKPEKPGGFLDFLPADYLARQKMLRTIEKIFASYGFDPIETPYVEFLETLSGEESETGKNIFTLNSSHDEKILALRFDHTVPFARLISANPYDAKKRTGIRLPWSRMTVGPVFRSDKPQAGRYRQFYQFDADTAGTSSMLADAQIIAIMYKAMLGLGVKNFVIKINNRKILNGLAQIAGIANRGKASADDITKEMMRILDKIDKIGIDEALKQLQEKPDNEFSCQPNLSERAINKIKEYLELKGDNKSLLIQCQEVFKGIEISQEGIRELQEILDYLKVINIPEKFVEVNFSIARGLDYYTGPVMETVLLDAPDFGSVFSGGRFDGLVSRFTGSDLPAVGASIGVDRLFAALDSLGLIDRAKTTVTEVMVLRLVPNQDKVYLQIANNLRDLGFNTEICFSDDTTFKSQFNFAISRGVNFVVICGQEELHSGTVKIKNLEIREQEEISRDEIGEYFKKIKK